MHPQAKASKDSFGEIALPRLSQFLDIHFAHPEFFAPRFAKDIMPAADNQVWEFAVESNLESQTLTLGWENYFRKGNDKTLVLYDVSRQQRTDMRHTSQYRFASAEKTVFRVFYGDESFVKENLLPESITVQSVTPNPFTTRTQIHFTLPESGKAGLEVFDLSGRKVSEVPPVCLKAGFQSVVWEGSSQKLPPGLYVGRLTVESGRSRKVETVKMILQ
jgi:hypothetical protein